MRIRREDYVTHREFWVQVFLKAIEAGKDHDMACRYADDAVLMLRERDDRARQLEGFGL